MRILALDTALARCSVAVTEDGRVLTALSEPMQRGHAERLAPMAQEAMQGADFSALDRIVVTTGPGSFTGLRVGLAFARGLALSLDIPCIGAASLESLALEKGEAGLRAAAIDAAGGTYLALYRDGAEVIAPGRFELDEARALLAQHPGAILRGPGAAPFNGEIVDAPDVTALALRGAKLDPARHPPKPLYLRQPDAKPAKVRAP